MNLKLLKIKHYLLVLVSVAATATQAQLNGNYTINQGAAASSTNYRSFSALANDLAGVARGDGGTANGPGIGGSVNVTVASGSGPYTEQVLFRGVSGASTTRRVTINGNNEILRFTPNTTDKHIVRFQGGSFYTINNLRILSQGTSVAWGVHFYLGSNDNILDNVEVDLSSLTTLTANDAVGIAFLNSTTTAGQSAGANGYRNIIRNCYIHGNATGGPVYAINVCGTSNVISFNQFINNRIEDFYSYGIYANSIGGDVFRKNIISRPRRTATTTLYGFYCINSNNPDNIIEENLITNMFGGVPTNTSVFYGWAWATPNTPAGRPWIVRNNIISNVGGRGARYAFSSNFIQNALFYHNTISFDDDINTSLAVVYRAFDIRGPVNVGSRIEIKNNIVSIGKLTSGLVHCVFHDNATQTYENNHNVYYMRTGANYQVASNVGVTYTTIAQWFAATGRDGNSVNFNPNFSNIAINDVKPTNNFLNNIAPLLPQAPRDINGQLRSNIGTDPGVIEFGGDAALESLSLSAGPYCSGNEITATVRVKNNGPLVMERILFDVFVNNVFVHLDTVVITLNDQDVRTFNLSKRIPVIGGGNKNIRVQFAAPDDDKDNDVQTANISVLNPPIGVVLNAGTLFPGIVRSGLDAEPDIISYDALYEYVYTPPTGYTNAQFNSRWSTSIELWDGNTMVPSSNYTLQNPAANNGKVTININPSYVEKTLQLIVRVADIGTTNCDTFFNRYMYVAPRPTAEFRYSGNCQGDETVFENASSLKSGKMTFEWNFGDGSPTSDVLDARHRYQSFGTFNAILKVTSNWNFVDYDTVVVVISESPKASFTVDNVCDKVTAVFDNTTVYGSGALTYLWDFGDGNTSIQEDPTHLYNAPGRYLVNLYVEGQGKCNSSIEKYLNVLPNPVASFELPLTSCQYNPVSIKNTSTIEYSKMGYNWNFNDNQSSKEFSANPNYAFKGLGNKTVKLMVESEFGCVDSTQRSIEIIEGIEIDFTNSELCEGLEVNFKDNSNLSSGSNPKYTWNIEGSSYNSSSINHGFTSPGNKQVEFKIELGNGCVAKANKDIVVGFRPKADFEAYNACIGEGLQIENRTTITVGKPEFNWTMDDGNTYNSRNPSHQYTSAGTYNISLIATDLNGACPDTATQTIQVNPLPSCDFVTKEEYINQKIGFVFEPTQTGLNYIWSFGDGNSSTLEKPFNGYIHNGNYKVRLRATTPEGCSCEKEITLSVANVGLTSNQVVAGVSVFPNPTSDNLNIEIENPTLVSKIQLLDIQGKVVLENTKINQNQTLSLAHLAKGVYTLKLESVNGSNVYKVVIAD